MLDRALNLENKELPLLAAPDGALDETSDEGEDQVLEPVA